MKKKIKFYPFLSFFLKLQTFQKKQQPIFLTLLGSRGTTEKLKGLKMEVIDCCYPSVRGLLVISSLSFSIICNFKNANIFFHLIRHLCYG